VVDHFYQRIDGWFDFQDFYQAAVQDAAPGAVFVEVGAWLGRSTAFMAVEIERSGTPIQFFVVDTWEGSPSEPYHLAHVSKLGGSAFSAFYGNMAAGGVLERLIPLRMPSAQAARLFADGSLDFVFIDACHDFRAVRDDINVWRRKVKVGGRLGGHDLDWPGLQQAVQDCLPWTQVVRVGNSWLWRRQDGGSGTWAPRGRDVPNGTTPSYFTVATSRSNSPADLVLRHVLILG
jgi:SAM-dependent methyltransferase